MALNKSWDAAESLSSGCTLHNSWGIKSRKWCTWLFWGISLSLSGFPPQHNKALQYLPCKPIIWYNRPLRPNTSHQHDQEPITGWETLTSACLRQSRTPLCSSTSGCWDISGSPRLRLRWPTAPLCPAWWACPWEGSTALVCRTRGFHSLAAN